MEIYLTALLQGLCLAGMALGIYLSMKIFNIPDITTDGSYTLGGAVTASMLTHQYSLWVTLLAVLLAGAVAGALTGFIHTKLRINALLAGILVMTALYSVNLIILGRSNVPLLGTASVFDLVKLKLSANVNSLIILVFVVVLLTEMITWLLKTDFGLAMRATGESEPMIKSMGVNTNRMKITGLAIANALTAMSGFFMTQFQGFADINMGIGIVIIGLGSVIIAETFINRFKIAHLGTVLRLVITGAVLFQLVLAVTLAIGVNPNLLKAVTAVFVLLIVGLPRFTLSAGND